jgi:hypothetical protein
MQSFAFELLAFDARQKRHGKMFERQNIFILI